MRQDRNGVRTATDVVQRYSLGSIDETKTQQEAQAEMLQRFIIDTEKQISLISQKITDVKNGLSTVAETGKYSDLIGIPSTFTPSSHKHSEYLESFAKVATDADTLKSNGISTTDGDTLSLPSECTDNDKNGKIIVLKNGDYIIQIYIPFDGTNQGKMYIRNIVGNENGIWKTIG